MLHNNKIFSLPELSIIGGDTSSIGIPLKSFKGIDGVINAIPNNNSKGKD